MIKTLPVLAVFFVIFSLVSSSIFAETLLRDPGDHFFDQSLGDLQEELTIAREDGKKAVMLFFEQEECPFCRRMKADVLNRPDVQEYYKKNFRIIPIDIEGDLSIKDFQGVDIREKDFAFHVHRVRATPVFLFVDLYGNPLARYTGATADIDEFKWLADYVLASEYKNLPFTKYKRQRRQQSRQ
ncbi:MAG: thioredoxin family protein [Gammaproteobacteria bacterium]